MYCFCFIACKEILHSTLDIDRYRLYTLTVYIHLPGKAGVTLHVANFSYDNKYTVSCCYAHNAPPTHGVVYYYGHLALEV